MGYPRTLFYSAATTYNPGARNKPLPSSKKLEILLFSGLTMLNSIMSNDPEARKAQSPKLTSIFWYLLELLRKQDGDSLKLRA